LSTCLPIFLSTCFAVYLFRQNNTTAKIIINNNQIRFPTAQSIKPGTSFNGNAPDLTSFKIFKNSRMIFSPLSCRHVVARALLVLARHLRRTAFVAVQVSNLLFYETIPIHRRLPRRQKHGGSQRHAKSINAK